jgi:hypothetical protein
MPAAKSQMPQLSCCINFGIDRSIFECNLEPVGKIRPVGGQSLFPPITIRHGKIQESNPNNGNRLAFQTVMSFELQT